MNHDITVSVHKDSAFDLNTYKVVWTWDEEKYILQVGVKNDSAWYSWKDMIWIRISNAIKLSHDHPRDARLWGLIGLGQLYAKNNNKTMMMLPYPKQTTASWNMDLNESVVFETINVLLNPPWLDYEIPFSPEQNNKYHNLLSQYYKEAYDLNLETYKDKLQEMARAATLKESYFEKELLKKIKEASQAIHHTLPTATELDAVWKPGDPTPPIAPRPEELDQLPFLKTMVKLPCQCHKINLTLEAAIIHLNDMEKWTREQIADWLDTLDIDMSLEPKTPDG